MFLMIKRYINFLVHSRIGLALKSSRVARSLLQIQSIRKLYQSLTDATYLGIPKFITLEEFFDSMEELEIHYVVLRWPELIGHQGILHDDLDLLVRDEDYERVLSLCVKHASKGQKEVDISTETAFEKRKIGGIPYFTPRLSKETIASRVRNSFFYQPTPEYHFYTLAYHAVYHKGFKSGLPNAGVEIKLPENKYYKKLEALRIELGLGVKLTLKGLHEFIKDSEYYPGDDYLDKLKHRNPFIEEIDLYDIGELPDNIPPDLFLIYVRKNFMTNEILKFISDTLIGNNCQIFKEFELNSEQISWVNEFVRGGNWPAIEGGEARRVIVGRHGVLSKTDYVLHMGELKSKIRENYRRKNQYPVSVIHSTDSAEMAYFQLKKIGHEVIDLDINAKKN